MMATIGALIYRVQADTKDFQAGMKATRTELNAAKRVVEATRTPMERYNATVERLNRLHKLGAIDTRTYNRSLEQAKREYEASGKAATSYTKQLGRMAVKAAAVAAAFIGIRTAARKLSKTMDDIDATAKAAERLDLLTENLIGLRHAAAQMSGMDAQAFDVALQRMTRRIGEAAMNGGPLADTLEAIGLNAQELSEGGTDQAFMRIADAIRDVQNPMERLAITQKLFDSEGVKLVTTLDKGSEAIRQMQRDAEDLGITFSDLEADRVESLNDALDRVRKVGAGLLTRLVVEMAPAVETLATSAADLAASMRLAATGAAFMADAIHGVRIGTMMLRREWLEIRATALEAMAAMAEFGAMIDRRLGRYRTTWQAAGFRALATEARLEAVGAAGTIAGELAGLSGGGAVDRLNARYEELELQREQREHQREINENTRNMAAAMAEWVREQQAARVQQELDLAGDPL